MAVKKAAAPATPREVALAKARRLLELDGIKSAAEKEAEQLKSDLLDYFKDTGENDFEVYTVSQSEAKPKLDMDALTDNMKKRVTAQLMSELPDFKKIKEDLDIEALYYAMPSNPAVANALKVRNLEFKLVSTYSFKKVK